MKKPLLFSIVLLYGCNPQTSELVSSHMNLPLSSNNNASSQHQNKGRVKLLWATQHASYNFSTQATQADIAMFRITLSGKPVFEVNNGLPASREIRVTEGGQDIGNIPPGTIQVLMEALDDQGQVIGSVQARDVIINAGKTTKINLEMRLIDSIIDESAPPEVGHLEVNLNIIDGKLTQKGAIIKPGDFLSFSPAPTQPTDCVEGRPVFSGSTSSLTTISKNTDPFLPPPTLNLQQSPTISGSSASILMKGFNLEEDLNEELQGSSSVCNPNSSTETIQEQPELRQVSLNLPKNIDEHATDIDLKSYITAQVLTPENISVPLTLDQILPDMSFSSTFPNVASVEGEKLIINGPGETQITMNTSNGTVVHQTISVSDELFPYLPPAPNFNDLLQNTPTARLSIPTKDLQVGETLQLVAEDLQGGITQFRWEIPGAGIERESLASQIAFAMTQAGTFTVNLKIKNSSGIWTDANESSQVIRVTSKTTSQDALNIQNYSVSPTEVALSAGEQQTLQFSANATSAQDLKYEWYINQAKVGEGQKFQYSVPVGSHQIKLVVSNSKGQTITKESTVLIREKTPNKAPDITNFSVSPKSGTVLKGQTLPVKFNSNAVDPEGGSLKYSWSSNGVEQRTSANAEMRFGPGTHRIRLSVSDNANQTVFKETVLNVIEIPNQAPIIQSFRLTPGSQEVSPGQNSQQQFTSSAYDPDNQHLSYQWFSNGTPISSEPTMNFTLSPGSHLIKLRVQDELGSSSEKAQTIVINQKSNQNPIIQNFNISPGSATVAPGDTLLQKFSVSAQDPDGDALFYEWSSNGTTVLESAMGNFTLNKGNHLIKVKVYDRKGGKTEKEQMVTIQERPFTYSTSTPEVTQGGGAFGHLLRLKVFIQGGQANFRVSKQDGSPFSGSGKAILQVGGGETYNTPRTTASFTANVTREMSLSDNLNAYSSQWPKDYFVRVESKDSQGRISQSYVGPIRIERR